MSQYGYKPRIYKDSTIMNDSTLEKSYAPAVASDFSCVVDNGTTADEEKLENGEGNQADSDDRRTLTCNSPNFFEIGLSNMTMEAFCGKSMSKVNNPSSEESNKLMNGKNDSYSSSVNTSGVQSHLMPSVKVVDCSME